MQVINQHKTVTLIFGVIVALVMMAGLFFRQPRMTTPDAASSPRVSIPVITKASKMSLSVLQRFNQIAETP